MVKCYTQFDRPDFLDQSEIMDQESDVDTSGYRSVEEQIRAIMDAGQRLHQARVEEYDYPNDDSLSDEVNDPTRSMDFDMADASQMMNELAMKQRKGATKVAKPAKSPSGSEVNATKVADDLE